MPVPVCVCLTTAILLRRCRFLPIADVETLGRERSTVDLVCRRTFSRFSIRAFSSGFVIISSTERFVIDKMGNLFCGLANIDDDRRYIADTGLISGYALRKLDYCTKVCSSAHFLHLTTAQKCAVIKKSVIDYCTFYYCTFFARQLHISC